MDKLPEKDNLNVIEVAEYFGVTSKTIKNWIKARSLTAFKIRGTVRITRESVVFLRNKAL